MRWKLESRPAWNEVLQEEKILLLPAAHDALAARMIERAGFAAYQIGGFGLVGAMHAVPDIDLEHYKEQSEVARQIVAASRLPVLVDGDDGYGDVKNVTRTVQGYEHMGASAIFIEDQASPKKCGHMKDKKVVPVEEMVVKVRAAVAARSKPEFFILARTDALAPEGVDSAISRAEKYLRAGADGVYIEGPTNEQELLRIGEAFRGTPLATSVLENGGKTPFLPVETFREMGFTMLLFPSTLIFQLTQTLERALENLRHGHPIPRGEGKTMDEFLEIVDLPFWQEIEKKFEAK